MFGMVIKTTKYVPLVTNYTEGLRPQGFPYTLFVTLPPGYYGHGFYMNCNNVKDFYLVDSVVKSEKGENGGVRNERTKRRRQMRKSQSHRSGDLRPVRIPTVEEGDTTFRRDPCLE